MNEDFSALQQLLSGYFNQDWAEDHDSSDEVISCFISEASNETFAQTKKELNELLLKNKTEQELQDFLFTDIGCGYYYPYKWINGKSWLEHIKSRLSER